MSNPIHREPLDVVLVCTAVVPEERGRERESGEKQGTLKTLERVTIQAFVIQCVCWSSVYRVCIHVTRLWTNIEAVAISLATCHAIIVIHVVSLTPSYIYLLLTTNY